MVMAFLASLGLALARPQVGHGSVNGPSGVSIIYLSAINLFTKRMLHSCPLALPHDQELGTATC